MILRHTPALLGSLLLLVGTTGCTMVMPGSEDVTAPRGTPRLDAGRDRTPDQRRADFPINHADYAKIGYRLDWIGYPTITGSLPIRDVAPYEDFVGVIEQGGRLTVLETNTGTRRCGDQIGNPLTRFMGLDRLGNQLVVATQAEIFGLDPVTCNLRTRFRTEKIASTAPVIYGDKIIFGTGAGEVVAQTTVGEVQGVKAWGFGTGAAIEGKPVLVGNFIGTVSQNGQVTFLSAQNGSLVGRSRIWGGLATNPVADDYTMFVASLDQSIYAFAAEGGVKLWRHRTPYALHHQPTLHEGEDGAVLYVSVPDHGLLALDAATGNVRWTARNFQGTIVGVNRGRLLGFDGTSAVLLDPDRGDTLERVELPGVLFLKPDQFEDGNLYVVSKSGLVARFNQR